MLRLTGKGEWRESVQSSYLHRDGSLESHGCK